MRSFVHSHAPNARRHLASEAICMSIPTLSCSVLIFTPAVTCCVRVWREMLVVSAVNIGMFRNKVRLVPILYFVSFSNANSLETANRTVPSRPNTVLIDNHSVCWQSLYLLSILGPWFFWGFLIYKAPKSCTRESTSHFLPPHVSTQANYFSPGLATFCKMLHRSVQPKWSGLRVVLTMALYMCSGNMPT